MVVVVFDQGRQVGEGQLTVQVDVMFLLEDKRKENVAGIVHSFYLPLFDECTAVVAAGCRLLGSYLSEQPVVSCFAYSGVPHHQHLNTRHMITGIH